MTWLPSRRTASNSRSASPPSLSGTASTGATTRCTTPPRKAPTPPTRRAPPAPGSSARMVQGLNGAGLRVVIDVVYNHTPAAGQDPKSILDRVVPGYYQRLNPTTGAVETSSCCANTATEHAMMEKLMIDSVVTWAKEYKLDGFRFDLMGHQPKSAMENLRRALNKLTLGQGRRRRPEDLPVRGGLELRRGRRQRPVRPSHPAGDGRHRHRHLQRPAPRRGPRRRPVRREPASPRFRLRPVHRPQR